MAEKKNLEDIHSKVKKDQGTHHIFCDEDQGQLADIIKQLGKGGGEVTNEQVQQIEAKKYADIEARSGKVSATDQEIEELFQRLSTFDLQKINEQQNLYNIYLDKLRKYKQLPNFNKVMKQGEYHMMIIDHLDHLSKRLINEQMEMEAQAISIG